jgi:hypothetical protein
VRLVSDNRNRNRVETCHYGNQHEFIFTWCLRERTISSRLKYNYGGKNVEANTIVCILRGRIAGAEATLVQLKTGDEVLLDNSEEEVVDEMNKFDIDR